MFNFQIMKHQLILFQILQVSSVLPKSLSLRHNALNCLSVLGLVFFFSGFRILPFFLNTAVQWLIFNHFFTVVNIHSVDLHLIGHRE